MTNIFFLPGNISETILTHILTIFFLEFLSQEIKLELSMTKIGLFSVLKHLVKVRKVLSLSTIC
jgi:hypothetical protein